MSKKKCDRRKAQVFLLIALYSTSWLYLNSVPKVPHSSLSLTAKPLMGLYHGYGGDYCTWHRLRRLVPTALKQGETKVLASMIKISPLSLPRSSTSCQSAINI